MVDILNIVDLTWAGLATLGAVYPLYFLRRHWQRQSARDLTALVLVFCAYPWAMAMFHLTPFDKGIANAICTYAIPLYTFMMLRFLGYTDLQVRKPRTASFVLANILAVLAITNPWHGTYALFDTHIPSQANHLLDYQTAGAGLLVTALFGALLVSSTIGIACIQMARSRVQPAQLIVGILLPAIVLLDVFFGDHLMQIAGLDINRFFLATTITLYCLNYSMMRNKISEALPMTHTKIIGLMPDAIAIVDRDGDVIDCNPAFGQLCDQAPNTIISRPIAEFLPDTKFLADDSIDEHLISINAKQTTKHYDLRITLLKTHCPQSFDKLLLLRDVTAQTNAFQALEQSQQKLNSANQELARISTTDPLTGLHNRRYFQEHLEAELERSRRNDNPFGILSIDIDHFKQVNDIHGHSLGDEVLVQTARIMEAQCRATDILARIGGEEFVVLLLDVTEGTLQQTAERFRRSVEAHPITHGGSDPVNITVSIGATIVNPQESVRSLLQRVDEGLYKAKSMGRNRSVVST